MGRRKKIKESSYNNLYLLLGEIERKHKMSKNLFVCWIFFFLNYVTQKNIYTN